MAYQTKIPATKSCALRALKKTTQGPTDINSIRQSSGPKGNTILLDNLKVG